MATGKLTDAQIAEILEAIDGVTLSDVPTPTFGGFGALRHAQHQVRILPSSSREPSARLNESERIQVARAFERVRDGYEPDRVLIDPKLSRAFLDECRHRGLEAPVAVLNRALQNIRKGKAYGIDLKESKKAGGLDAEPYLSVAELAYAHLNQIRHATVDQIVTNPRIGEQFVSICKAIDASGSAMIFKWAVLSLRKRRALTRERVEKIAAVDVGVIESRLKVVASVAKLRTSHLPAERGVFAFAETDGDSPYLYVGASHDLATSMRPFEDGKAFRALSEDAARQSRIDRIQLLFAAADTKRYLLDRTTPLMASMSLIQARHPLYNMLPTAA